MFALLNDCDFRPFVRFSSRQWQSRGDKQSLCDVRVFRLHHIRPRGLNTWSIPYIYSTNALVASIKPKIVILCSFVGWH